MIPISTRMIPIAMYKLIFSIFLFLDRCISSIPYCTLFFVSVKLYRYKTMKKLAIIPAAVARSAPGRVHLVFFTLDAI